MALCGNDQDKERLVKRLNRIEGQIRGLARMVNENADCIDVLRQVASASGAIRGIWLQIVGDHIKGCITNATINNENTDQLVDELINNLKKIT